MASFRRTKSTTAVLLVLALCLLSSGLDRTAAQVTLPPIPLLPSRPTVPPDEPVLTTEDCIRALPHITECALYELNQPGAEPASCCYAVTALIKMSKSKAARVASCNCVKNVIGNLTDVLPGSLLNVIGFPFKSVDDCSKVP